MSANFLISILTYRMDSGVKDCIESVFKAGGRFGLHLTANGCPEAAHYFSTLRNRATTCEIVVNEKNLGFIQPNEAAYRFAQAHGFDYLITLNDDATVPPNWLRAIESEFNRHPSAAIVGAKGSCRSLNYDFHGYAGPDLEYIEGSCAAYNLAVWKRHFLSLYPSFLDFAYGEDSCTSLEVRRLGYTIHEAKFFINHKRVSTGARIPQALVSEIRNHTLAIERYRHYLKHRTFRHRIIVKRKYSLGDVILATPVIRELWKRNPLCEICVETNFPEVFDGNLCVDMAAHAIAPLDKDMVIDLNMASENAPMRHFVRSYANAAGVELPDGYKTEIYPSRHDPFEALDWSGDWVALHTGPSTWRSKEWKAEKWNELMDRFTDDGWRIVLVGHGKLPGVSTLRASRDFRDGTKTVNDLASLLLHTSLFVGLDSGPMHVAAALGIKTVGIFGITDPRYILVGDHCAGACADPLHYPRAGERHRVAGLTEIAEDGTTINSITPQQVFAVVKNLTVRK